MKIILFSTSKCIPYYMSKLSSEKQALAFNEWK